MCLYGFGPHPFSVWFNYLVSPLFWGCCTTANSCLIPSSWQTFLIRADVNGDI